MKRRTYTCARCGLHGHNKSTCTAPTISSPVMAAVAIPPGIKVCSALQRRRTPRAFAEWLVGLARSVDLKRRERAA